MAYSFSRTKHIDPRRDWIRQNLPDGKHGFTFEDLDGIASTFSNNGISRPKRHLFVEHKWNVTNLPVAQRILFQEIHTALKKGDPYYGGFYLVTWPGKERSATDDEYEIDFARQPQVNGQSISWDDLQRFYLGELHVKSLFE